MALPLLLFRSFLARCEAKQRMRDAQKALANAQKALDKENETSARLRRERDIRETKSPLIWDCIYVSGTFCTCLLLLPRIQNEMLSQPCASPVPGVPLRSQSLKIR